MPETSWAEALSESFLGTFFKKLADQAEKDPVQFLQQGCLFLLPFFSLAIILTYKLSNMIEDTRSKQKELEEMKKKK